MDDSRAHQCEPDSATTAVADVDEPIRFREISPALEVMAWVVVALCPMLRLVNGAPVTDDQAAMQVFLVVAAVASALGLRFYNWRVKLPNPQKD